MYGANVFYISVFTDDKKYIKEVKKVAYGQKLNPQQREV